MEWAEVVHKQNRSNFPHAFAELDEKTIRGSVGFVQLIAKIPDAPIGHISWASPSPKLFAMVLSNSINAHQRRSRCL